ncbi:MAG: hypothetical protein ACYDBB_16750 [Armatimonadota bacterium]
MKKWLLLSGALLLAGIAQAETPSTPPPATVEAVAKGSLIKIDGRLFVGFFDTEKDGSTANRSLDVPDAKLRFTYKPSKDFTVVSRLSFTKGDTTKSGTNVDFDYLYLDLNNWSGVLPGHTIRLGRMKIDFGQETLTDNPVEGILITNSASVVSGYDEGVSFLGPIPSVKNTTYSISVLNGSKGFANSANGLATTAKIATAPIDNLFFSASYYTTGSLVNTAGTTDSTDLKIANLQAPPANATDWERKAWEVDARWNYGKTGIKSVVGTEPTAPFQLAAAYGHFTDDVLAGAGADREGKYWYLEGLYNVTPKLYLASRISKVDLDHGYTDKLAGSPVAVNSYRRTSLGLGYRLSTLTHLKAEYTTNNTSGGATNPKLNQIAVGIATKF